MAAKISAAVAILAVFSIASAAAKSSGLNAPDWRNFKIAKGTLVRAYCACPGRVVPDNFCSEKDQGNYPDPFDCHKYVACTAGHVTTSMTCANGTAGPLCYVPDSGPIESNSRCDYCENVNCQCTC